MKCMFGSEIVNECDSVMIKPRGCYDTTCTVMDYMQQMKITHISSFILVSIRSLQCYAPLLAAS